MYTLLNCSVLYIGICLQINDSGLYVWISLTVCLGLILLDGMDHDKIQSLQMFNLFDCRKIPMYFIVYLFEICLKFV